MLAINQVLQDRYRITHQLGQGGMGAVYAAIDERFGEPIALKEIIINLADQKHNDLVVSAFEREAKALAKAKHDAVPFVRDYFSEFNRQFLVMELVEGEDLAKMLEKRGQPFPLEDILKWMEQLLDALDYLHNLKPPIIHRDIKPQNLKLNVRGRIKLLDFGIARSGDKSSTITNQTFIGATQNYSPIEQILRVMEPVFIEFIFLKHKEKAEKILKQDTDVRCDIYALGATFYHLLTNYIPKDATKRVLEVWEGKPDPLRSPAEINPNIPPNISDCLLKAMSIEYENRYGSAIEMQDALQTAVAESKRVGKSPPVNKSIAREQEFSPQNYLTRSAYDVQNEVVWQTQPHPTYPMEISVQETQPPVANSAFIPVLNTAAASTHISQPAINNKSLSSIGERADKNVGEATETNKTFFRVLRNLEKPVQSNSMLLWILPTAFLGLLAIGGIVWIAIFANGYFSNKSVSNSTNSTSAATKSTSILPGKESGNSIGMEFVSIPAGSFMMGSPKSDSFSEDSERPQHRVNMSREFYLGKYEITQEQWQKVMGNNPSYFKDCSKCPVEQVSRDDVKEFITKLNAKGEGTYRLPTEAEWEYSARAGTTAAYYADVDDIGWYNTNANSKTHPVGQKQPNAWGLYDMSGNVWEWCEDWYGPYAGSTQTNPKGAQRGSFGVIRGGSWVNNRSYLRSANHYYNLPANRNNGLGFRLVKE